MITALLFTLLATTSAATPPRSWIKGDQVYVAFYDLTKIYGPLKFYVSDDAVPTATTCATCPEGTAPEWVVPSSLVYQSWPQGGRYLEARFPLSAVGNRDYFYFTAVSVVPYEERFLASGVVPNDQRAQST